MWRIQLDREIPDLQAEFKTRVSIQLQFVCRHWITLLLLADCMDSEVMATLTQSTHALRHWIAAMGIMGEIDQVQLNLKDLYLWLVGVQPAM
jgi:hypothetical protein